jgi:hypothetical protein
MGSRFCIAGEDDVILPRVRGKVLPYMNLELFHMKNARFSPTSAQKMHGFQPLLPKKCTFFSHFCPKNACFSATST